MFYHYHHICLDIPTIFAFFMYKYNTLYTRIPQLAIITKVYRVPAREQQPIHSAPYRADGDKYSFWA